MTEPNLTDFVAAATEFCSFSKSNSKLVEQDLWKIRKLLIKLLYNITAVEEAPNSADNDGYRFGDEVFNRAV